MKNDQFSGEIKHSSFFIMSVDVKFNKIFVYIFEVFISSIFLPLFFLFCFIGNVGFFYHFMLSFGRFELARYFSIKKKLENKNWNQFHFSESAQIKALLNVEMENPIQWYLLTKRGGPINIHLFYTVCVFFSTLSLTVKEMWLWNMSIISIPTNFDRVFF